MKEVSCRVFNIFFKPLAAKGVAPEQIVEGTGLSLETLRSKNERVDWADFCAVMRNIRPHFTDDEYIGIGRSYFRAPTLRFAFVIARMLFTPMGFYRWINKPRDGVGNQMFTCIVPSHREISETECEVELMLPDGFEVCWDFYIITIGNFMEMPRLLGLPPSRVQLTRIPRGGRFHIVVAKKTPLLTRLRRAITWPFTVRAAARELKEAHESLQERYEQLEAARSALERKQIILDAAYNLGHSIWSQREPQPLADELTRSLVGVVGITGARLTIDGVPATEAGVMGGDDQRVRVELEGRRMRGRLEASSEDNREEARALLDLLAPNVALAVDNALAHHELAEYQHGLERKVEERTAELRLAQEARERIFANISHEIRTPLSLILLAVADVETRAAAQLDAASRENLTSVVESARKLLRLVDELLLLAAGRETQLRINPQPTDVGSLVAALTATWRPAAEAADLRLGHVGPENLVAMVDPVAFERVVTNLLSNAVKFTPRGGRIAVEVARKGEEVVLTVRDTGIGIDDDLLKRLFGRFERGRASGAGRGGSGIGLSLVKELVEAHGGKVSVARLSAGGTEFMITVPATETAHPVEAAAPRLRPGDYGVSAAPISSGEIFGSGDTTVLVAEDDPRLAAMVARLLAEEHRVVVALDGLAALDLVRQHQPHLLVTDVDMPGMDGVELTRRFREITDNRLAPVVILSANADPTTRLAGLEAGAVDYVVKPFDPTELKARVRSQLRMRDLALRLHRAEQLSALGTLSSGLAHELRNPANGIVNAVGPLKKLLPEELRGPNSGVGQLVAVLGSCAEQIAFLSRQLLSFKRGGELELKTVPLGDIVERALTLAQPALREIAVREQVADDKPLRCAPPLMVQVLTNLVENAAHAAGAGGWVEIASSEHNGTITVEVADSGPGVPVELRERIFEPFFTTKPPGVGTGLGLPLARDIVHRHGGVLEIRERDQRSVFVVELPNPSS